MRSGETPCIGCCVYYVINNQPYRQIVNIVRNRAVNYGSVKQSCVNFGILVMFVENVIVLTQSSRLGFNIVANPGSVMHQYILMVKKPVTRQKPMIMIKKKKSQLIIVILGFVNIVPFWIPINMVLILMPVNVLCVKMIDMIREIKRIK